MPFIPHTEVDIQEMLKTIGVEQIDDLFDEIPAELLETHIETIPEGLNELEVSRLLNKRAGEDGAVLNFMGAGAYEHHIPAAIWSIVTRGEFYSAYTPYQAEASQGTLQLIYEYQTMMAHLTAMDVANASLYDGASGLAEAVLMAVRANRKSKSKRILMPTSVHPSYRKVVHNIVKNQGLTLEMVDYDATTGHVSLDGLPETPGDIAALVIPQPNYFGVLEAVDELTNWAHERGALVIAVVNPTALALLTPPGEWGESGADIVCGEGQPLGIPLASGGPYFGFMCCTTKIVRQMPGRIVGRTVDLDGKTGYTLTLQAREQHIRRSKATSNICTNQGLMVSAGTIYMSLIGDEGLRRVAVESHNNTYALLEKLAVLDGVSVVFDAPHFHEAVVRFDNASVADILDGLAKEHILGGMSLVEDYPELGEAMVVCVTETKLAEDIDTYIDALKKLL